MKRVYKIEGIDCADCAGKLEAKLAKIDKVKSVNFNFVTQKCTFEAEKEDIDEVIEKAIEIISTEEPEAAVSKA